MELASIDPPCFNPLERAVVGPGEEVILASCSLAGNIAAVRTSEEHREGSMRFLAGLVVCLCAAASYAETPEIPDRFEVPPIEFEVDLNGQETGFVAGETRQVGLNGQTVTATLEVKHTRLLQTPDFSFRFPQHLDFEYDREDGTWTVETAMGRIALGRTDKEEMAEGLDTLLRESTAELGKGSLGPSEIRLGGRKLAGRIIRGKKDEVPWEMEAYFLTVTGDAPYFVLIMRVRPKGVADPDVIAARQTMIDTFAFGPATGNTRSAPFEFVLKLDGVSLDLVEHQERTATVGQASVKVRVTGDVRVLRTPELALRYPDFYEFEGYVDADDGSDNWQMNGGQQMVLLVRTRSKADAPRAANRLIEDLATMLGRPTATKAVETSFGGEKRKGTRAEFKKDGLTVASEMFPFSVGDAGYVLAFQEKTEGEKLPLAYAMFRKSVEQSLTLGK
jgi:hypothetical protein